MRKIRNLIVQHEWSRKLAVQLGALILAVNMLFFCVCAGFQYSRINKMFLENYENDRIERFEQAQYSIKNFCDQVELTLQKLSIDKNLLFLVTNHNLSDSEKTYYGKQVLDAFKTVQSNYPYIQTVTYYGNDGLIIKSVTNAEKYFFEDTEKNDSYYVLPLYEEEDHSELDEKWFGGYTKSDFGLCEDADEHNGYYITTTKNVRMKAGKIVINMDMDYFLNLFSSAESADIENDYIIDGKNQIIVTKDEKEVGIEKEFEESESVREGIKKYVEEYEEGDLQVMVCDLPFLGWKMVNEIPVEEVTKQSENLRDILVISCVISLSASFIVAMWWIRGLLKPLKRLTMAIQKTGEGKFGYTLEKIPNNEIGILTDGYNHMLRELQDMFERTKAIEKEKRELEMQALRSQINPHLIYNTLNTIKWMALVNDERNIAESIALLSDFLGPVFKKSDSVCCISEELDYVKKYIAVMNLRVAGGYSLEIDVPEKYLNCRIMRFLLQPIVENAIVHGFDNKNSGKIRISMREKNGDGFVQIEDDGVGIEKEKLKEVRQKISEGKEQKKSGIGIENVSRRIAVQYGAGYGVEIHNGKETGTVVIIKIRLKTTEFEE